MIRLGRRMFLRCVLALGALIPIQPPVAFAAEQVDLLLVLASDVSRSVVIDWTIVDGQDAARKFGDQLLELPRSFADRTSISGGIEFAAAQLERAPFESARRTIDVSGDGTNNAGRDVKLVRDEVVAKGIVINGLVILSDRPVPWNAEHTNPPGGLEKYYQENVIGGPGAFVLVAENFNSFGRAIIKKLIAEIAFLSPAPRRLVR